MSTSPTIYAERIMTVLHSADTNTSRAALHIAETLLEHKVNAEAAGSLDELLQSERCQALSE